MQTVLDARSLPVAQRVDYWRGVMMQVLRADCRVEPIGRQPFEATMDVMPFGSWNLVQVTGTAQATQRLGAGAEGWVSIMCQLEGLGRMTEPGREAQLRPGDICIVPPDREIVASRLGGFRQVLVNVPQGDLDEALPYWRELTTFALSADRPQVKATCDLVRYAVEHRALLTPECRSQLNGCAKRLLGALPGATPESRQRPALSRLASYQRQRVERFILEHLRDSDLSVARVARELTMSVRYVHKLFEAQGQQVMQWAQAQRLQACRQELKARGGRPVSDIAYAWGYASPSHFSHAFKRQFGLPPSAA